MLGSQVRLTSALLALLLKYLTVGRKISNVILFSGEDPHLLQRVGRRVQTHELGARLQHRYCSTTNLRFCRRP
jgi:hypothetical protein